MLSTTVPLSDITVQVLNAAKGVQLKFWIEEANQAVGKKALMKTGTVNTLRMKLAEFYGLDLAATLKKPAGPITHGHNVQKQQFAYLQALEQVDGVCGLEPIIPALLDICCFALPDPLPKSPLPAVMNDTYASSIIHLGISCSFDTPPQLLLLSLNPLPSLLSLPPHQAASCTSTEASPAALPMSPVTTSILSIVAAPAQSDKAVLLVAYKADIAVLIHATSLHDVIAQVEAGDVACIWQLYGPCTGCAVI
ncbi:hypothetical protein BDR06DRAFT_976715 [Suillus hirtellus]|nr:hypothetical protein BDR06DRAFT_976715 [Suillus hirtellus]